MRYAKLGHYPTKKTAIIVARKLKRDLESTSPRKIDVKTKIKKETIKIWGIKTSGYGVYYIKRSKVRER